MEVILSVVIIIAFLGTVYPMRDVPKNNMDLYGTMPGAESIALKYQVNPMDDIRNKNVIKQKYDYSCGSAALAMLLDGYLGEKLSEQQIIQGMMQYGDVEKINQRRAFSLLDMKKFAEVLGYKANGYKADFEDLKTLDKPAIVPIEFYGYKHFIIYRGINGDHVLVSDPNMGNTSYTIDKFKEMWSNQSIVFVVSSDEVKTNALKMTNEDMRFVDFDMSKPPSFATLPEQFITQEIDLRRSQGEVIRLKR